MLWISSAGTVIRIDGTTKMFSSRAFIQINIRTNTTIDAMIESSHLNAFVL